ncbi:hypothetical protein HPB47_021959 [Ixodes persulcatus]|uniref:Uncharacterized protein n=1 Tax=Ixodes persulcatus TaxID=34615 RepID=A0AC60QB23_IXOPE|nr:hypothetical protein HPB47_021959 [Ixodes persulcatus]
MGEGTRARAFGCIATESCPRVSANALFTNKTAFAHIGFDVSRCPDLVPEASRCRHRGKDDVHRGCHRTHERAGAPLARLAQPMVVVHEVELLDERARPPYLHHPQLSAGQGTVPLAHHHARQLKLPGGASSLPRHQQLPSAPYH